MLKGNTDDEADWIGFSRQVKYKSCCWYMTTPIRWDGMNKPEYSPWEQTLWSHNIPEMNRSGRSSLMLTWLCETHPDSHPVNLFSPRADTRQSESQGSSSKSNSEDISWFVKDGPVCHPIGTEDLWLQANAEGKEKIMSEENWPFKWGFVPKLKQEFYK